MNRIIYNCPLVIESMPHVCGDEPYIFVVKWRFLMYAPRMWG